MCSRDDGNDSAGARYCSWLTADGRSYSRPPFSKCNAKQAMSGFTCCLACSSTACRSWCAAASCSFRSVVDPSASSLNLCMPLTSGWHSNSILLLSLICHTTGLILHTGRLHQLLAASSVSRPDLDSGLLCSGQDQHYNLTCLLVGHCWGLRYYK